MSKTVEPMLLVVVVEMGVDDAGTAVLVIVTVFVALIVFVVVFGHEVAVALKKDLQSEDAG